MDKKTCEAELKRVWGADYAARLETARTVFRTMPDQAKAGIDENSASHIRALAAMGSEAYQNPKHADHARASSEANSLFVALHGTDTPLI